MKQSILEKVEDVCKQIYDPEIPQGQYDNLPETFTAMDGKEYLIARIYTMKSS